MINPSYDEEEEEARYQDRLYFRYRALLFASYVAAMSCLSLAGYLLLFAAGNGIALTQALSLEAGLVLSVACLVAFSLSLLVGTHSLFQRSVRQADRYWEKYTNP